jgi:hypothetical protein
MGECKPQVESVDATANGEELYANRASGDPPETLPSQKTLPYPRIVQSGVFSCVNCAPQSNSSFNPDNLCAHGKQKTYSKKLTSICRPPNGCASDAPKRSCVREVISPPTLRGTNFRGSPKDEENEVKSFVSKSRRVKSRVTNCDSGCPVAVQRYCENVLDCQNEVINKEMCP